MQSVVTMSVVGGACGERVPSLRGTTGTRLMPRRKRKTPRSERVTSCEALPASGNWEHGNTTTGAGSEQSIFPPSSQTTPVHHQTHHHQTTMASATTMVTTHSATIATNSHRAESLSVPSTDGGGHGGSTGGPPNGDGRHRRWGDGDSNPSGNRRLGPLALLLRGVRGRLEADPYFGTKLLIECGLDAAIITGANMAARKERFWRELEFTFCHLAISLLSDFGLVYLLAPSTTRPPPVTGSLRARLKLNMLPAHVFQLSPPGKTPFTPAARFATLLLKGVQYGAIGLGMGALGAMCVHGLIYLRETFDSSFDPPKKVQSVLGTGAVWSGFMATSSNIRYNALTAMEDAMWVRGPVFGKAGSFVLRLLNNYAGAAQWVKVTSVHNIEEDWVPRKAA